AGLPRHRGDLRRRRADLPATVLITPAVRGAHDGPGADNRTGADGRPGADDRIGADRPGADQRPGAEERSRPHHRRGPRSPPGRWPAPDRGPRVASPPARTLAAVTTAEETPLARKRRARRMARELAVTHPDARCELD